MLHALLAVEQAQSYCFVLHSVDLHNRKAACKVRKNTVEAQLLIFHNVTAKTQGSEKISK